METKRYAVTHHGHHVELEFDKKLMVMNRARLEVDGAVVDSASVVYGNRDLATTLPDGTEIVVKIHSGMVGELVRAQLRRADGSWVDLDEREPVA